MDGTTVEKKTVAGPLLVEQVANGYIVTEQSRRGEPQLTCPVNSADVFVFADLCGVGKFFSDHFKR